MFALGVFPLEGSVLSTLATTPSHVLHLISGHLLLIVEKIRKCDLFLCDASDWWNNIYIDMKTALSETLYANTSGFITDYTAVCEYVYV